MGRGIMAAAPIATTEWTGAGGDGRWDNPANWSNGVPPAGTNIHDQYEDRARIDNDVESAPFTVLIDGADTHALEVDVAATDPTGGVAVSLTGGLDLSWNASNGGANFGFLELDGGTFEIDGGTLSVAIVDSNGGTLGFGSYA